MTAAATVLSLRDRVGQFCTSRRLHRTALTIPRRAHSLSDGFHGKRPASATAPPDPAGWRNHPSLSSVIAMHDNVRFSQSELEDRRPVWDALSSMYLDTDVSLSRDWRIQVLSASPYSLDQMDSILRDEVHPVCLPNLLHPSGEWAGFDPAWLEQAICDHRNRWLSRLLTTICRTPMGGFPTDEWTATRRGIASMREHYGSSDNAR